MPVRHGRRAGQVRGGRLGARKVSQLGRGQRRPGYRAGDWALVATGAVALTVALAAAGTTKTGHAAIAGVARFLLFYAGVFALIALTASVAAGLAAADRVVMSPGARIAAQAAHRAASFGAVAFLGVHLATEVLAGRSRPVDAMVPFLGQGRTFYLGLGTIASDLLVVVVVTGLLRGRFARARPAWLWRALHAMAYACWPIAIVHGLLAGRTARPYVDWSYGACVGAVLLALVFRAAAGSKVGETATSRVEAPPTAVAGLPDPVAAPLSGAGPPGLAAAGFPYSPPAGLPYSPATGFAYPPAAGFPYPAAAGFPYPASAGFPYPPAPGFPAMPGPGSPHVPGAAGAWGRRALPGPAGLTGPATQPQAASAQDTGPNPVPNTGDWPAHDTSGWPAHDTVDWPAQGSGAGPTSGTGGWPTQSTGGWSVPGPGGRPTTRHAPAGPGYPGAGYRGSGWPGTMDPGWPGDPDLGHSGPEATDPGHSGPRYPEVGYPGPGDRGPSHPGPGSGYRGHPSYPGPGPGYRGHPSYPGLRWPGQDQPAQAPSGDGGR